jgi:hypothetical protein
MPAMTRCSASRHAGIPEDEAMPDELKTTIEKLRLLNPDLYVSPTWAIDNPQLAAAWINHLKSGLVRLSRPDPLDLSAEDELGARRVYALAVLHGEAP